jgi:Uma2 family endonuclease
MSELKFERRGEQDYLQGELSSEQRYEYVAGQVFAMAGAGEAHNLISLNIYYYPDIMVACDPSDNHTLYKERPSLVIEVLSPSTERTDRREKMLAYRTLTELREYVLVTTDKRHVEIYHRDAQEDWQLIELNLAAPIVFASINKSLTLDEIYEDVKLEG